MPRLSQAILAAATATLSEWTPALALVAADSVPKECKNSVGKVIPLTPEVVNDDFCDCADGSDEPATGACAGQETTMFHCENIGSTPQLIYTSRVGDGICDCCDGSDEAVQRSGKLKSTLKCVNRCKEEGRIEAELREKKLQALRQGLEKKSQIMKDAVKAKGEWAQKIKTLEQELPALEKTLEEAKQAAAEAAKNEQSTDSLKAQMEELMQKNDQLEMKVAELQLELDNCRGVPSQAEGGSGGSAGEKKVVSEYAKWMDGAGSTPGAIEGEEVLPEDPEEEGAEEHHPAPASVKSVSKPGKHPAKAGKTGKPEDENVKAAENKVKANKDEVQKLKKQLGQLPEDQLGYASLAGQCINKHDGQYTYKLCFFDDAKQDHTSLGKWSGFKGPREAEFTNGQMCPGGPARMLRVIFECGDKEVVTDISEPSRCVYEARVTTPGACDEEEVAKVEKPPLRHPKDEL
mmetsp:Transcript_96006/g.200545  ORF Transcript_96006/g.200545 Transcript_96006/m.200545 type:complete len:462 (+) Transcript_96006:243-1628(+)|eukprot:CAMPEP_0206448978 /NCGR_PEP_ID=MMETSP0324_2-20121206/17812_1 /ASSEMBLY_ACC=CAM_ASM_000836 /TAXON_ID=2866 /ORGANISM="Crypthecodinium cohnii, Strain Seligo" /LENGTH=461 /DNA_ID=CAMNT_0053918261 /DNA_START=175 /DNA_END=1560 /DNA_ORIENTATION=+